MLQRERFPDCRRIGQDAAHNIAKIVPSDFDSNMRALLIPFHFPPMQGSTGALRSLAFARWLPSYGWSVTVLTATAHAYPSVASDNLAMIPADVAVERAFALDAQRHFSIRGRYWRVLALPDRWASWIPHAVAKGLAICRRQRPDVLVSTYPIPSSHLVAWMLHRITRIPWVAEFRDPMVEEGYPEHRLERNFRIWIERRIFACASKIVVVTDSAQRLYAERAGRGESFVVNIPNGFDEHDALGISAAPARGACPSGPLTILHSGVLYPRERNPEALLVALARLVENGWLKPGRARFVFRGAGNEAGYRSRARELGLEGIVEFLDSVSYSEAKAEIAAADALMVLQSSACNRQIPAKVYECLAAGKPLLCLADPCGDTAQFVKKLGLPVEASLEDATAIESAVKRFLQLVESGQAPVLSRDEIAHLSRRSRAAELAAVLDDVVREFRQGSSAD